eukprot:Em0021g653a
MIKTSVRESCKANRKASVSDSYIESSDLLKDSDIKRTSKRTVLLKGRDIKRTVLLNGGYTRAIQLPLRQLKGVAFPTSSSRAAPYASSSTAPASIPPSASSSVAPSATTIAGPLASSTMGCLGMEWQGHSRHRNRGWGCQDGFVYFILDMDLPDNLQRVILKVRQSTTNDELQNVFATTEEQDLLLQCGFSTPLSSLSITMRDTLVSVIVDYHCIVKCIAMMDQFRQGLNLLGVLDMVQMHPHIMKKFFVHHNRVLSCDALIDVFGHFCLKRRRNHFVFLCSSCKSVRLER